MGRARRLWQVLRARAEIDVDPLTAAIALALPLGWLVLLLRSRAVRAFTRGPLMF